MRPIDRLKRGGILLEAADGLRFAPASVTVRIAPPPRVTPVPGAPPELLGIALHEGTIVPVVSVGRAPGPMVVCRHAGELVGIVGARIVKTGLFTVAPDRPDLVVHEGQLAPQIDLGALCAGVQSSVRPGRWGPW